MIVRIGSRNYILAETRWESTLLDLDDVLYLRKNLTKIEVYTVEETVEFYGKIEKLESELGDNFYPVLKGSFLNLDKITKVKDGKAYFGKEAEYGMSERSFSKLKRAHSVYYKMKSLREKGELAENESSAREKGEKK